MVRLICGDFQRVRQARTVMIVGLGDEHLGLVHQPAEGGAMDDAVAVALVQGAELMGFLGMRRPRLWRVRMA